MSLLTVLPLALVVIAGLQLISAILLATGHGARRNSLMVRTYLRRKTAEGCH